MKKYLYLLSTVSAALIIGCGDGSSVSDTNYHYDTSSVFGFSKEITYKNYLVNAVDDPIIHATVKATNCEGYQEIGNGQYLLTKCVGKPLYIEIKNGIIKDKNVTQDFPLLLNVAKSKKDDNFIVTPLTTILANADENNISELADTLGVSEDELFNSDNEKIKKLLPKINAILITANSQGAITNKIKFLNVVREEVVNEIKNNGDINVSKTLKDIKNASLKDKSNFFGLVIIPDNTNINDNDPLKSLAKIQNSKEVRLYGLVFDDKISDANISIKDLDANISFGEIKAQSDENGAWNLTIDENETNGSLYYTIMNEDHLLQFIATKNDGNKVIKLTSTVKTTKLRNLIKNSKIVSPSKDNSLIISNVTTAQDAILDKRGALNQASYEGNLSELRVYYQDKVVKAATIIKSVVDENASLNIDVNNTYDLVKNSISNADSPDLDVNTSVVNIDENNLSKIENNITNNTILASQLNDVSNETVENSNKEVKDEFQKAAEQAQYVFYRLLAYYKANEPKTDNNFIREYTKIIVYPSHYETKTCYLKGDSTDEWDCNESKVIEDNSNFTLGYYEVNDNNKTLTYSLDFNNSFYVKDLNKNYNYYGVIKSETDLNSGITTTEPMILVDSYDVVDAFRRLPTEGKEQFNELKDTVKNYNSRREVNYALNRWVKKFMNDVDSYFDDNDINK